ncbi:Uncharacterised protein [Shigella sonnei]|nr:Uncharacterised protein [Shigella sonnei]
MIIAVPKMAAIWLFIKVEISSPIPVAMMIYSSAARVSVRKLPLCGTPNTNTDRPQSRKKFSIPSAMYGSCLPSKNSLRVVGVT